MKKKPHLILIICLSVLTVGLWSVRFVLPAPVFTVENRKTAIYNTENVPTYKGEGSININTATKEELCSLPGIGETIAERIISHREMYGAYLHPEAIMEVHGIGETLYGKIKDKICTG